LSDHGLDLGPFWLCDNTFWPRFGIREQEGLDNSLRACSTAEHPLVMSLIVPTLPQAVAAAVEVARVNGLGRTDPKILHAAGNAWIHLRPAPVVAQVPKDVVAVRGPSTETHLRRDIEICEWLAARGCAVGAPADVLAPGPHEHAGVLVAFYKYYERGAIDDALAGSRLREIHEVLVGYERPLVDLATPIEEPRRLLGLLQAGRLLPAQQLHLLRSRLEAAARHITSWPMQPVHGDAHLGNVLRTTSGPLWTDWEDLCRAPLLWDLACLVASTQVYCVPTERLAAVLRGYGNPRLNVLEIKPFVHARVVGVSAWAATRASHDERSAKRLRDGLNWLRHHHL